MAYDERLGERLRAELGTRKRVVAKHMFGGLALLLNGNMCVGVHKDALIVRIDPADTEAALARPHARIFDITGRPMKGWILVEPAGVRTTASLRKWVAQSVAYVSGLPNK